MCFNGRMVLLVLQSALQAASSSGGRDDCVRPAARGGLRVAGGTAHRLNAPWLK